MTLTDLLPIRGQLADGLEAYLQSFVDLSAWATTPAFLLLPSGISQEVEALGLYQSPDVLNLERLDTKKNQQRIQLDARGEFRRGSDSWQTEPWGREREKPGCAVILGRPGEGKTLLTRLTCRDVALESLALLRARSKPIVEIPIPIWLRLEDILEATTFRDDDPRYDRTPIQSAVNATMAATVADAIDGFYPHPARRPAASIASAFIKARVKDASTWLFIDALDERGNAPATASYQTALTSLPRLSAEHIVVTCRKHEYSRQHMLPAEYPSGWLREYDLEPLNREQQRAFVERWFGAGSAYANDVLALIDIHEQFRDMASNGLMLTLMCATRERHSIGAGTRRVQLYELVLRDMVGRARQPNPIGPNDPELALRLHVLEEVIWPFFARRPDNNSLPIVEWRKALITTCHDVGLPFQLFEDDLKREGLLLSQTAGAYRFLHRSFFEYVAASRLAQQGPEVFVEAVRQHVDDEPWREVLIMAIGCLALTPRAGFTRTTADVAQAQTVTGEVVDRLITEPGGTPGVALALVGDAIVEAGESCIPADALSRLRIALLRTMRSDGIDGRDPYVTPKVRAAAGSALGRLGDPRFHGPELWCLPKCFSDPGADGKLEPDDMLGFVEIPAGEFWMGSNTE